MENSEYKVSKNYKFGDNTATVYDGKLKENTNKFLNKLNLMNSLCLFFICFLVINILNTMYVESHLATQTQLLKEERQSVLGEQKKLKKQIVFYKSQDGVESLARESLGLIRKDELPVKYIENLSKIDKKK